MFSKGIHKEFPGSGVVRGLGSVIPDLGELRFHKPWPKKIKQKLLTVHISILKSMQFYNKLKILKI